MKYRFVAVVAAAGLVAACGGKEKSSSERPEVREALDASSVGLIESLDVAIADTVAGEPFEAALLVQASPAFDVGAEDGADLKLIRVNGVSGTVESNTPMGGSAPGPCPGQISLAEALGIAEIEASGDAVAVVPDDDVACAFEIQVISGTTLWEVKVAADGAILEHELSDEYN